MEVTRSNFKEMFPRMKEAIENCDFIAIDTEFTGLKIENDVSPYDTIETYYEFVRTEFSLFLPIQVGICCFTYNAESKSYSYVGFNAYPFPPKSPRVAYLCEGSSMQFLAQNGFDFNKLFLDGIPYLTFDQESERRKEVQVRYENEKNARSAPKFVPIPDNLSETLEQVCGRIENFINVVGEEVELNLGSYNSVTRKFIYQTAYDRFPDAKFCLEVRKSGIGDWNLDMIVVKGKSKIQMLDEKYQRDLAEVEEAVGFSAVIRCIANAKKCLVGHNMLLDLSHIVKRFCVPLPHSAEEFKQLTHGLFPMVLDTKFMCMTPPLRDVVVSSVLEHLADAIQSTPFSMPQITVGMEGYGFPSIGHHQHHNACYDAYVTGAVFVTLLAELGKEKVNFNPMDAKNIRKYANKIYLMRLMDQNYIKLDGKEPSPSRKNVFYMTFPECWDTNDILEVFRKICEVQIRFIDSESAWITAIDEKGVKSVEKKLMSAGNQIGCTLVSWQNYNDKKSKKRQQKAHSSHESREESALIVSLNKKRMPSEPPSSVPGKKSKKKNAKEDQDKNPPMVGINAPAVNYLEKEKNSTAASPKNALFEESSWV